MKNTLTAAFHPFEEISDEKSAPIFNKPLTAEMTKQFKI
jgi:hypothetical protein